jgi:UDP-glucose:glycoprotein glucosyltransferase
LTKEPKLARARQIPEWDVYDQEVAAFARRIEGKAGKAMASSVEALAGDAIPDADSTQEDAAASVEENGARRIEDEL